MDWKLFIAAGDAIFTVGVPESLHDKYKTHYTYRIQYAPAKSGWPETYFIKLLVGPDNTRDYANIGRLIDGQCKPTARSMHKLDSPPVKLLNRVLYRLLRGELHMVTDAGFTLNHEGRCARCGRALTVPLSVERGIGPECYESTVLESQFGRGARTKDLMTVMQEVTSARSDA